MIATGCGRRDKTAAPIPPPSYNDTARFLAGLGGEPNSPYRRLENDAAWKDHAARLDKSWTRFQKAFLAPARAFEARELSGDVPAGGFVFYPFSGPDVVYLFTFFPRGDTYVLVGLEPAGEQPVPSDYSRRNLAAALRTWRVAAGSLLHRSFFITDEMEHQLHGADAEGALPLILLLMARTGNRILGARHARLDAQGRLSTEIDPKRAQALEIVFRRARDGRVARLCYFSRDLARGMNPDSGFPQFLQRQGAARTFVKSGSYLLHSPRFRRLRRYVLENSIVLLQDDTGIPFRMFDERGWQVRLYGDYSPPGDPFRHRVQEDLAAAFEDPARNIGRLGFSLGYGAGRRTSSLLFAVRNRPGPLLGQVTPLLPEPRP
jgi:hypothetical protein